jgi:NADP-dependent 3-hydroxy acid dehydrogenase YdfG
MVAKPLVAITGASSGIGAATARAFSNAGHPLLLMARRMHRMEELGLPDAHLAAVDVRDRAGVVRAVAEGEERFGPTDVMFANAGLARLANIFRQDPAEWDESIDINTKGLMNSVYPVMNGMKERRRGTIFMMSSIAGRKTYPDHTIYCGTKFFVHAVSESLRAQLAPHEVRVVVLSPGIIETEVLGGITDEETLANYNANKKRIEGGISADHVAEMILFAYRMPQNVLIQEMVVTPTRQEY